jgi:outer membrane protein OmpA-like peptidoglycan-associated protein
MGSVREAQAKRARSCTGEGCFMLKNFLLASAMALSVYSLSTSAEAGHRPQGWYIGIEAGGTWLIDADIEVSNPVTEIAVDFDDGLAILGEIGYRWDNNWRLELELGSRHNDVDCFSVNGGVCNPLTLSDVSQFSQMVNLIHDIDITERTAFSVGIGLGGNFIDADGVGLTEDDDYVFAAQAIFQLSHELTDQIDLVLSYRFMTSDDPEFRNGAFQRMEMETESHTVSVGLRFDLDADAMEPMPVVASDPPAAAPLPAPKQFIVFFGFNKANLSKEARGIVREAAAAAMQQGYVTIVVTGHTDTVGSARYNEALSARRAGNVRKALVSEGIPAAGISASGKGETMLMVQTGDREMEPRNRRAEINLN